ncbi:MAG: flavin reductase family protein [Clostridia bacterium]|nr:flavin reductase family protein [Clostridia bacterium]
MKKNVGNALALYPTPLAVIGTMVDGKANYALVGHVGIIGHDRILVSLAAPHYTNRGIKETHALTVNLVNEAMLPKADYVGCVSGCKTDKSAVFAYHTEETGAPVIEESPVVMDCSVVDVYETEGFESFICKIAAVYADESVLTKDDKIEYRMLKPVLFEMPTYEYLRTGDVIGKCMSFGKELAK